MLQLTLTLGHLPSGLTSVAVEATASGGGAERDASADASAEVGTSPVPFGLTPGTFTQTASSTQAGGHPDVTTTFALNQTGANGETAGSPKALSFKLPLGLTGNPLNVPRCAMNEVIFQSCPAEAEVGVATLKLGNEEGLATAPIFNVAPKADEPAAFAFAVLGLFPVRLDTSVDQSDYRLRVSVPETVEDEPIISSVVTFWGVPADHDGEGFGPGVGLRRAFLRAPTQCESPLASAASATSWEGAQSTPAVAPFGEPTGCEGLPFAPSASVAPDNARGGAPASFTVHIHIPQPEGPDAVAASDLDNVRLTLPPGVAVSPSSAGGLAACGHDAGDPTSVPNEFGEQFSAPPSCVPQSAIGSVTIVSPALETPLEGQLYLGAPDCSPCTVADAEDGAMIRLLLYAGGHGVTVKREGYARLNAQTGQISSEFRGNPQLPFSDLNVALHGGERAPLVTPTECGPAMSEAVLTPWSEPLSPAIASSVFTISECSVATATPTLRAGTVDATAGRHTTFAFSLARSDTEQRFAGIRVTLPPGLVASLKGVTRCTEAAADSNTCPADTTIGSFTASAGAGTQPFTVGGTAFLTGPHDGDPFGLAFATHVLAGPFDLGTVIVRAGITVDPHSAQVAAETDPSGPFALPTILDGVPLNIRALNVRVDRPNFVLNPTDCAELHLTASVRTTAGQTAELSNPFKASDCARLGFSPRFSFATSSKTSRANGAELQSRVTALPGQANIARVRVQLPKSLPSRQSTLRLACLDAVFEAGPGRCPLGSVVGSGTVNTPLLASPLSGSAYLVSHGGAAFPDLEVVLSGEGVRIVLDSHTNIRKGITTSTFEALPDVPIESFALSLPRGPHSILGAFGSLCKPATIPLSVTGTNGAQLSYAAPLAVKGCKRRTSKRHGRSAPNRRA